MSVYRMDCGLILKRGDVHWRVHEVLDAQTVQIQRMDNRHIRTVRIASITKDVLEGKYKVVSGDRPDETSAHSRIVFCSDSLKERHRLAYLRTEAYVAGIRKRRISKGRRARIAEAIAIIAAELQDADPPSTSTVMTWLRQYEAKGLDRIALVSRNACRKCPRRIRTDVESAVRKVLKKHYFVKHGCTLEEAHDLVERELNPNRSPAVDARMASSLVSLSTVRKIAYEVTPFDRDRIRLGKVAACAKWRYTTGTKYATRPLERVEMDHTLLDLWVIDDKCGLPLGRPTVTLMVCSYSGYIVGFYISFEGESLSRVVSAIKVAIQPKDNLYGLTDLRNRWHSMGLWETLLVDNGLAFHSGHMKQIALDLAFDLEYSAVRRPWYKPNVERALGALTQQLPTQGRPQKPGRHPEPIDAKATACITFTDLCQGVLR